MPSLKKLLKQSADYKTAEDALIHHPQIAFLLHRRTILPQLWAAEVESLQTTSSNPLGHLRPSIHNMLNSHSPRIASTLHHHHTTMDMVLVPTLLRSKDHNCRTHHLAPHYRRRRHPTSQTSFPFSVPPMSLVPALSRNESSPPPW